ncbi:MAG: hypothetical protein ACFFBP_10770 [Promethearchaeota archaeon]
MTEQLMSIGGNILFAIIQWIIALTLIFRAKRTKVKILYLLALAISLDALATSFFSPAFTIFLIAFIMFDISVWSHLIFITKTFYKDKKSPISILLAVIVPISIVHWIMSGIYDIGLDRSVFLYFTVRFIYSILLFIAYAWMAYSLIKSYLSIKNNKMVEPWIKARYLLVITYSAFGRIIIGILIHFNPPDFSFTHWSILASAFVGMIGLLALFLAWVMPKGFKKWLNRNFTVQVGEEILTEEELMKHLEEA